MINCSNFSLFCFLFSIFSLSLPRPLSFSFFFSFFFLLFLHINFFRGCNCTKHPSPWSNHFWRNMLTFSQHLGTSSDATSFSISVMSHLKVDAIMQSSKSITKVTRNMNEVRTVDLFVNKYISYVNIVTVPSSTAETIFIFSITQNKSLM